MAGVSGKEEYQALLNRTEKYAGQVRKLFAKAVNDILALTTTVPHLDDGEVFSYSKQKKIEKEVSDRLRELHSAVYAAIKNDIALEWEEANNACDELAISCFGKRVLSDEQLAGWFERNTEAMDAFISRSEAGLTLSDRIWQPVKQLRSEMELAMTVAIGDGDSASQISRYVRKYLNDPDKLFRQIRDEKGNLKLSKAAKAYHPGQGVYRSSAKNAMRIARTETNIAYRRADNTRWQQMDFVLGQEVRLSRSHPVTDICDTLAGKYPKDFVFDGWHPQCFCFVTPILLSEEEMVDLRRAKMNGEAYDLSGKTITEVPDNFKSWVRDNKDRIAAAERKDKLPYFIKNNKEKVERIINPPTALETAKERHAARILDSQIAIVMAKAKKSGETVQEIALSIAKKYDAQCTPINYKSISSIKRKVLAERQDNPGFLPDQLKDSVRTTIIADKTRIQSIINELKKTTQFFRWKPQNTELGYTGYIINLKMDNGIIAEIQVNTPKMIYAKETPNIAKSILGVDLWNSIKRQTGLEGGLGHKYYEEYRVLNKESSRAQKILELSVKYYSHFID